MHRFRDECQFARRWLDQGYVGVLQVVREVMNAPQRPELPAWVTDKEMAGGGVLMYSAIHAVDRLRWLVGADVAIVTGQTRRWDPLSEVEDGAAVLLTFTNGAAATLTANAPACWAQPAVWETEIFGTEGMLRIGRGTVAYCLHYLHSSRYVQLSVSVGGVEERAVRSNGAPCEE